eukprot:6456181-Amphidinium_carterae.2
MTATSLKLTWLRMRLCHCRTEFITVWANEVRSKLEKSSANNKASIVVLLQVNGKTPKHETSCANRARPVHAQEPPHT